MKEKDSTRPERAKEDSHSRSYRFLTKELAFRLNGWFNLVSLDES